MTADPDPARLYIPSRKEEDMITDARVDWNENWDTAPVLHVYVDELPKEGKWRRSKADPKLWWSEVDDGFVRYLSWSGEGNDHGSLGYGRDMEMEDGRIVTALGSWSGRAGWVNNTEDAPVIVDVTVHADSKTSGHNIGLKLLAARIAAKKAGVDLLEHPWHGETIWVPDPRQGPVPRCLGCMVRLETPQGRREKCSCGSPVLELL